MKLIFLGTRGNIQARTRRHNRHSSLLVSYGRWRVMIDCGEDWLGHLDEVRPQAIFITHAHPDHAWGLKEGAPCPVYATEEPWREMKQYPIEERHTVAYQAPIVVEGMEFEAFELEHSLLSPAVSYRVTAGRRRIHYAPDIVYIRDRAAALRETDIYIGDGATFRQTMVRRKGERLFGHTPISTQLTWCQKEGVPRAIITHCGSQIVKGDEGELSARLRQLAEERGVRAEIAYDGMEVVVR